ncbi:trypsin-like peptidase domain-containing protein [uncultured Eubacterium sp.]|uniref:S1C family serine protease n=1 Tax=uncultured Eubacterium sp. TaxID=165185 RepID=UPI0025F75935|nr:trypsin-like peptidase domain-containing protein [uncultured Eubacterium sp.]
MDEYNNNQNNVSGGNDMPNGEYHFVPPRQNQPQNNTNQGSQPNQYSQPVNQGRYYQNNTRPNNGTYYTPNNANMYGRPVAPAPKPPKKKNKALKVVIIVAIVVVAVSIFGIAAAMVGNNSSSSSGESTTQSDSADSTKGGAKINDSKGDVATKDSNGNLTVAGVAEKTIDSCVLISVYSEQNSYYDFYNFGQSQNSGSDEQTLSGEGSGVIMSENGGTTYIMTAAHVISDGSTFKVTTNDGKTYDATIVGYDSQTDIGVLSIKASGLQVAEFANSDDIVVGEQAVVIGCPGGSKFMNSVTTGIVSALDRPVSSSIGYDNECIQTDAAINPGNSGGALFNMSGQVIGINSSKIASTDYEGMGFAVPSNTAVKTANSLIKNGYVAGRAKLGITYNTITNASNASAILAALEQKGYKDAEGTMIIGEVDSESDLANKDVRQYDMIVAINGNTMTSTDVLTNILSKSSPGDTVTLTIARIENNNLKIFDVKCKLIESKG